MPKRTLRWVIFWPAAARHWLKDLTPSAAVVLSASGLFQPSSENDNVLHKAALSVSSKQQHPTALDSLLHSYSVREEDLARRSSRIPAPQWCLPTCSSALTRERATSLKLLTKPEPGSDL